MPAKSGAQARFDHVDDTGDLVFYSGTSAFHVQVDDKLERAILEAKQVLRETSDASPSHELKTLPISKIQALIRAGEEPDTVAQQYGLSPALVRRFTSSVQTEKQDAIEQFLAVNAPKGSRMRTVGDLIESTLAAADVDVQSVQWNATREGREPWKIRARFDTERNSVQAVWTWNMRDNGVECSNTAAKILLGEMVKTADAEADSDASEPSPVMVRDERRIRTQESYDPLPPYRPYVQSHQDGEGRQAAARSNGDPDSSVRSETNRGPSPGEGWERFADIPHRPVTTGQGADDEPSRVVEHTGESASDETDGPQAPPLRSGAFSVRPSAEPQTTTYGQTGGQGNAAAGSAVKRRRLWPSTKDISGQAIETTEPASEQRTDDTDAKTQAHAKRKGGRSAMPSWDEIMFGD